MPAKDALTLFLELIEAQSKAPIPELTPGTPPFGDASSPTCNERNRVPIIRTLEVLGTTHEH